MIELNQESCSEIINGRTQASRSVTEDDLKLLGRLAVMAERRAVMSLRKAVKVAGHACLKNSECEDAQHLRGLLYLFRQHSSSAADDGALALALVRRDGHAHVEAVDEADPVGGEVSVAAVVEVDLDEGGRDGAAAAAALEAAATGFHPWTVDAGGNGTRRH